MATSDCPGCGANIAGRLITKGGVECCPDCGQWIRKSTIPLGPPAPKKIEPEKPSAAINAETTSADSTGRGGSRWDAIARDLAAESKVRPSIKIAMVAVLSLFSIGAALMYSDQNRAKQSSSLFKWKRGPSREYTKAITPAKDQLIRMISAIDVGLQLDTHREMLQAVAYEYNRAKLAISNDDRGCTSFMEITAAFDSLRKAQAAWDEIITGTPPELLRLQRNLKLETMPSKFGHDAASYELEKAKRMADLDKLDEEIEAAESRQVERDRFWHDAGQHIAKANKAINDGD